MSPLSWTSNFTLVLDAGANQHGVTLLAGRLSGPAMCRFGPAPWSGRAVSEEDEEDENEELFSRGSPPSPWPMVEGGWGELYCSQNVKRSLPITVKQSLSQKGHGKGGGSCRDARGAPPAGKRSLTIPCHFGLAVQRRQGSEPFPSAAVLLSEQGFAPCALDNAQCRKLQTAPRSPH